MNVLETIRLTRAAFPGAEEVYLDLHPGRVRVTVSVGGFHSAMLKSVPRLGRAFLDGRRVHLIMDLLHAEPDLVFEVGWQS